MSQKWEYFVEYQRRNQSISKQVLNGFGADGWELVDCVTHSESLDYQFIFKRPRLMAVRPDSPDPLSREEIFGRICRLLEENLGVDPCTMPITRETRFRVDFNVAISVIEDFVLDVEEMFRMHINVKDDGQPIETMGQLVDYIYDEQRRKP